MLLRRAVMVVVVGAVLLLGISGVAWGRPPTPEMPGGYYRDLWHTDLYAWPIENLTRAGVLDGYGDGRVGASCPLLRQQFAKMMARTLNLSAPDLPMPFVDVAERLSETDPLYPSGYVAMCWAAGITEGKDATHFAPYENVTLHQLVTMVVRGVQPRLKTPPEGWVGTFSTKDPIHGANVRLAEYNGLLANVVLNVPLNRFRSLPWASRGECAGVLHNVMGFLAASE